MKSPYKSNFGVINLFPTTVDLSRALFFCPTFKKKTPIMNFENRLSHVDVRRCDLCFVNICIALSQFLLENILNKASSPLGVQK